jgi:protein gp37
MAQSSIEWTQHTWNPTTGCTKVSPGCKNCYAEVMTRRLVAMNAAGYENGFRLTMHDSRVKQPLARKVPTTYFVNSMSDLFHEDVHDSFLDSIFETIRQSPQHTYQILTKRAERLPLYFAHREVPKNVWLGVSVEDKKYGLPRIDYLCQVKAAVRFLSIEPLLEDLGEVSFSKIDWVIVGGESGLKARSGMTEQIISKIQVACERDGAAFFFKQWGAYGADGVKQSKAANGRLLKNRTWDLMPVPRAA